MKKAPLALLLASAAVAIMTYPSSAGAITLTNHVAIPHGITKEDPEHVVLVTTVPPEDSDDDGCRNANDSYDGPGCNAPAPPPIATTVNVDVAPVAEPATTTVDPASVTTASAPVDINCESGGDYSINTGNGYYGAYQFDSGTWDAYGDPAYGEANEAPPAVQDAAAASVPYDAWPNC